jgi:hypothetical protein
MFTAPKMGHDKMSEANAASHGLSRLYIGLAFARMVWGVNE